MRAGETVAWPGDGREEWERHKHSIKAAGAAPLRIWPGGVSGPVAGQPPQGPGFWLGIQWGPFTAEPS